jgi:NADH-quinone oxidoreductase subunit C
LDWWIDGLVSQMENDTKITESGKPPPNAVAGPGLQKAAAQTASAAPPATAPATPPAPAPNPLSHLSIPFRGVDFALRGFHAEATVNASEVVSAAEVLDSEGFAIDTITGVDWLAERQMEITYDFFHPLKSLRAVVRTRVPRGNPELPTISTVFPGANWHEREAHDFFGIRFSGHPNLEPFLLPEDATYHPLKKDFTAC